MHHVIRKTTEHEALLFEALKSRGVNVILHHYDGHNTVDLAVLSARLYIEVDDLSHFINPNQFP